MNFYILSVSGWEEYSPIWFSSEKSAIAFRRATRLAIRRVFATLVKEKYDQYVNGHSFLERIVPEMEKLGFQKVKIESAIDLEGSCLYRQNNYSKRPAIFPHDIWDAILKHNTKIHKRVYRKRDEK